MSEDSPTRWRSARSPSCAFAISDLLRRPEQLPEGRGELLLGAWRHGEVLTATRSQPGLNKPVLRAHKPDISVSNLTLAERSRSVEIRDRAGRWRQMQLHQQVSLMQAARKFVVHLSSIGFRSASYTKVQYFTARLKQIKNAIIVHENISRTYVYDLSIIWKASMYIHTYIHTNDQSHL